MTFLIDPEFWARVFGIIIIDLTLAGDNALVIALAVRNLPKRQQFLGRVWGTLGAVGLRLAFITIATILLRIPFLQLGGGLLLFWIAFVLTRPFGATMGDVLTKSHEKGGLALGTKGSSAALAAILVVFVAWAAAKERRRLSALSG